MPPNIVMKAYRMYLTTAPPFPCVQHHPKVVYTDREMGLKIDKIGEQRGQTTLKPSYDTCHRLWDSVTGSDL